MNNIKITLLVTLAVVSSCKNDKTDSEAVTKTEIVNTKVDFKDFETIAGVDDVSKVPFHLFSKLDSVQLFTKPDKNAPRIKIENHKLNNYYGFAEKGDFYEMHYSIGNNFYNTILAYVLKSEFKSNSELTFEGLDLYEIRSSTLNGKTNYDNKSFASFGTIEEVSEAEFLQASQAKIDELLVKNPNVQLKGNQWMLSDGKSDHVLTLHKEEVAEEGIATREYIGYSKSLKTEIFKEFFENSNTVYYSFFETKNYNQIVFTSGFPHIIPAKRWISYITTNSDVGSDFIIDKFKDYDDQSEVFVYVNFTNFSIVNYGKSAFWSDDVTFYAQVEPLNSSKPKKPSYIKIKLKPSILN